jgi:type IX secretion system PorP/SprF family membrane protein
MRRILLLLPITVLLSMTVAVGQDIHFTQYNMAPLVLNPAMAGNFEGTIRVGGIYRSQWTSVLGSNQFETPSVFADAPIIRGFRKQDWIGVGISVFRDSRAGALEHSRTNFGMGGTYHIGLSKKRKTYLSIGGQFGNETRQVDPATANPEDKIKNSATQDELLMMGKLGAAFNMFNAGLALNAELNKRMDMVLGFAVRNVAESNYGLQQIPADKRRPDGARDPQKPRLFTAHGQFNVAMTDRWTLSPGFLFQTIAAQDEIVVQAQGAYLFDPKRDITLSTGLGYRLGDAVNLMVGGRYKNLRVGLAYDINTSDLSTDTNYRGGFELAANYIIKIYKPAIIKPKVICPRF